MFTPPISPTLPARLAYSLSPLTRSTDTYLPDHFRPISQNLPLHPYSYNNHCYPRTMSPPLWLISIPVGFAYTFFPRLLSLVLQIKSGVPLQNAFPREQPESKEVAMKDTDGYVTKACMDRSIDK